MRNFLKGLGKIFSAEMPPQYSVQPSEKTEVKPVAKPEPEPPKSHPPQSPQTIEGCCSLPVIDRSTPGFAMNPRAGALTKLATKFKQQGDMAGAIEALEAAEVAMAEGEAEYAVDSYCKLPLYLQQSGRGEEAVQKLIELLDRYPPSWGKQLRRDRVGMFKGHIERQRSTVYDKLRLVLQRDGKFEEAIPYAVLAETYCQRIDNRIYRYVAKKWDGKPEPPEPDYSNAGWKTASTAQFEWHEFQRLKEQYADADELPEIRSVQALLKKLKRLDLLEPLQKYAHSLGSDFKKPDEQVILEVQQIIA